jgi:hypothetical protein
MNTEIKIATRIIYVSTAISLIGLVTGLILFPMVSAAPAIAVAVVGAIITTAALIFRALARAN